MTRSLQPADLHTGRRALWLLDIEWAGMTFRMCSESPDGEPLRLTDSDGTVHTYRATAGLSQLSFSKTFPLFAESAAPSQITIQRLYLDEVNVAELAAQGHTLDGMRCRLYRYVPGMAMADRVSVFYGVARQPSYGAAGDPIAVTFVAPQYRDGAGWPDGRVEAGQITVDADLATGDPYPVVFGSPGLSASEAASAGSPAYPIDASGKKLLGGIILGNNGSPTLWRIADNASEALTSNGYEFDELGRRIYTLVSSSVSFDAEEDYGIQWTGDDIGAGDLLAYCARAATERMDLSVFEAVRDQLNGFKLSGYIDAETKVWSAFALREILPLLPASVTTTADGVALAVWDDLADATDAVFDLTDGVGISRVGGVQVERSDVYNEITIRYAPDNDGKFTKARTITGRENRGASPEVIFHPVAARSQSRYARVDPEGPNQGVRSHTMESQHVYDDATAVRVLTWMIRAHAYARRVITYEDTTGHLEALREGQLVTLTSSDLYLTSQLCMVRSRTWAGGRFFLDLMLLET